MRGKKAKRFRKAAYGEEGSMKVRRRYVAGEGKGRWEGVQLRNHPATPRAVYQGVKKVVKGKE